MFEDLQKNIFLSCAFLFFYFVVAFFPVSLMVVWQKWAQTKENFKLKTIKEIKPWLSRNFRGILTLKHTAAWTAEIFLGYSKVWSWVEDLCAQDILQCVVAGALLYTAVCLCSWLMLNEMSWRLMLSKPFPWTLTRENGNILERCLERIKNYFRLHDNVFVALFRQLETWRCKMNISNG